MTIGGRVAVGAHNAAVENKVVTSSIIDRVVIRIHGDILARQRTCIGVLKLPGRAKMDPQEVGGVLGLEASETVLQISDPEQRSACAH
jgi:hypothetical protein